MSVKVNSRLSLTTAMADLFMRSRPQLEGPLEMTTSRVFAALLASAVTVMALPTAASAGCYGCYTPPPCPTCYQRQVAPPQYRAVQETVMVSPRATIAHPTPAQY